MLELLANPLRRMVTGRRTAPAAALAVVIVVGATFAGTHRGIAGDAANDFGAGLRRAAVRQNGGNAELSIAVATQGEWIQLFNGRDLTGWTPKITGYDLGDNFGNTFRVEDGLLKVAYDQYAEFDGRYGHLFYDESFSHYVLRIEYRFVGEQAPGGPGWAIRNSGVMIHGEPAEAMSKDQDFPVSIEVQFLGGSGEGERTTANLCTPGTNVVMHGELVTRHCTNSSSRTYEGEEWVTVETEVRGGEVIRHSIDGQVVLEYEQPQLDDREEHSRQLAVRQGGLILTEGTISLQSESHPIEFRRVELRRLNGGARGPGNS